MPSKSNIYYFMVFAVIAIGSIHQPLNLIGRPPNVRTLMRSVIVPSADLIWGAAGTITDYLGTRDLSPKTDDDWAEVEKGALGLVEGASILVQNHLRAAPVGAKSAAPGVELEPIEIEEHMRQNRRLFNEFAVQLRDKGIKILELVAIRDSKSLLDVGEQLDETCERCHSTFWYPKNRILFPKFSVPKRTESPVP